MIRRVFFASLLAALAPVSALAQRRKRRAKARPKSETINPIEKAQLLASFDDDQIRTALDIRFLSMWTEEELRAELAAREIRRRKQ